MKGCVVSSMQVAAKSPVALLTALPTLFTWGRAEGGGAAAAEAEEACKGATST